MAQEISTPMRGRCSTKRNLMLSISCCPLLRMEGLRPSLSNVNSPSLLRSLLPSTWIRRRGLLKEWRKTISSLQLATRRVIAGPLAVFGNFCRTKRRFSFTAAGLGPARRITRASGNGGCRRISLGVSFLSRRHTRLTWRGTCLVM